MKWLLIFSFIILSVSPGWARRYNLKPPKAKPYLKRQVLRARFIRDYKFDGRIGESAGAMLKIRTLKGLKKAEQKRVIELVKEENVDRKKIMAEIMKYNKMNKLERENLVKSFHQIYRNTSAKGTYYDENGAWRRKN